MGGVDKLVDQASALLDDPKQVAKAKQLLEQALAKVPTHVLANYYLGWKLLGELERWDAAKAERISSLSTMILAQDIDVDDDTPERRARSFALAWKVLSRVPVATAKEAQALIAAADEALEAKEWSHTLGAKRAADMALAWAKAGEQGKPEKGYAALIEWVKENPVHGAWTHEDRGDTELTSRHGLEPFFADTGYVAWIRDRKPEKLKLSASEQGEAMCNAAGRDLLAYTDRGSEPAERGRRGRILTLRALGVPLDVVADDAFSQDCAPLLFAAFVSDELVRFLLELGAPIDGTGKDNVPLVQLVYHGEVAPIARLLAAGANRDARADTGMGKNITALELATKRKAREVMKRPGAKSASTAALDTKPIRDLLAKRAKTLAKARWFPEDGELDHLASLFETIRTGGIASWPDAASELESLDPHELLVLATLLRELHPGTQVTTLTKQDAGKARLVLGDAVIDGDAIVGGGTHWVITGDLTVKGQLEQDEAARLAIGGNLVAPLVITEGELWVGGNLDATVVWAEYAAGSLVVAGTLSAKVFVTKKDELELGRLAAGAHCEDTTQKHCAAAFPVAAFDGKQLSRAKVWKLIKTGKLA